MKRCSKVNCDSHNDKRKTENIMEVFALIDRTRTFGEVQNATNQTTSTIVLYNMHNHDNSNKKYQARTLKIPLASSLCMPMITYPS